MTGKFAATAMMKTSTTRDARLEISLVNAYGHTQTVILTPDLSLALSQVLADFARTATKSSSLLTKMPREFAVGSGVHESVVLVRFENEVPYGLEPNVAAALGQALLDQSLKADLRVAPRLQ